MRLTFGAHEKCPPIVVAASGPKMLHLAGQMGDGVIIAGQACVGATLTAMMDRVQEGRRQGARADRPFSTYLAVAAAVHPDGSKALAAVRPHVARGLLTHQWPLSEPARRASEQLKRSYDFYEHMSPTAKHGAVVPDEVVREFAIAGTPADCLEQVKSLAEAGFDEITIRPYAVGGGSRADVIEAFAREVVGPYYGQPLG
jgi:5,10-methylenetetrahydromethanopterin reductase